MSMKTRKKRPTRAATAGAAKRTGKKRRLVRGKRRLGGKLLARGKRRTFLLRSKGTYNNGFNFGYNKGFDEGFAKAFEEGYQQAYMQG